MRIGARLKQDKVIPVSWLCAAGTLLAYPGKSPYLLPAGTIMAECISERLWLTLWPHYEYGRDQSPR